MGGTRPACGVERAQRSRCLRSVGFKRIFPIERLQTLNQGSTDLPSHCDKNKTPSIDMSTGLLGQGISVACGIAWALRKKKSPARVYAVLGDGELQEGQFWEAFQFIAQQELDNLNTGS